MTRQDLPRGEAPTVARHSDSIPYPAPLWEDPAPDDGRPRCWRCGHETGMVVAGRPTCWSCRYVDDARPDDRPTSRAAARSARRGVASPLAQAILGHLGESGPATDDELSQAFLDEHPGSISKRRGDLVAAGLVADSGSTRPTRRGRQAVCWVVA